MALKRIAKKRGYGFDNALQNLSPLPIIAQRAPTTSDITELGTVWLDQVGNDIYTLLKVTANAASWVATGAGAGSFDSVTATTTIAAGTTITAGTGLTITTGNLTIGDFTTAGILSNTAAGVIQSSAGTDGQVIIGATGAAPAWATIVSGDGSMSVTTGANSVDLRVTGAAASTFPTDVGTATPALGATTMTGGTNINTAGAGAVVTINVDNAPTFSGLVTAQAGITQSAGTTTITSDTNGAQAIYLHADGGINETIDIHADQGTGTGVLPAVDICADVGGVGIDGGAAAADAIYIAASNAAGGIDVNAGTGGVAVDTTGALSLDSAAASNFTITGAFDLTLDSTLGSVIIDGGEAAADAIQLTASDAAGGVTGAVGTGGYILGATNGPFTLTTGTGNISIGSDAAAKAITIGNATGATSVDIDAGTGACTILSNATDHSTTFGSTTGVSAMTVQSGTGAMTFTAGGIFDVNATGNVTIDSTGGTLGLGEGADAQNINIGTGAAARTITIGNATGATAITVNAGTGAVALASNATDHTTTVGSTTGASDLTLQAGTNAFTCTAGGAFDVNAVGNVTIDSTGGTLGIGEDADAQNINIGTGAAARTITIGNGTGATSVVVDCGTGNLDLGVNAVAHATNVGSATGAATTTIQSGTGGITLTSGGLIDFTPDTQTAASPATAVTSNTNVFKATYTGFTTAAAATQQFTVNNTIVSATSGIICTVANTGANDARIEIQRITPGAGLFTIDVINNGAAALNGNVIFSCIVLD